MAHSETVLTDEQQSLFTASLKQRQTGLPVAYITGSKEFYGIDFIVTPDVLIPKPDTELLVEHALAAVRSRISGHTPQKPLHIIDVCTGSGCIALSVFHELDRHIQDQISLVLTDISPAALSIAQQNAAHLLQPEQIQQLCFLQGDLLDAVVQGTSKPSEIKFDIILSNPPYIPAAEVTELLKDGRNEPRLALDGDAGSPSNDGLAILRRLIPQAYGHLAASGLFLVETGEYNAMQTAELMKHTGFSSVETFCDLSGQLRLTQGIRQK